ncbi:MAG: bifunctional glutamate N-acetyltransferase/amino-acid acetyltransferase ArgJ [Candidatus Adiutrix sp.]|jgi:glutamate N-acetyltransferase/amino-acid N-acetyltransferase|nr:bifunctional glutamate N-acetyltransferase/amino-acid acetyltransferase ArgJ [Candidatus Adiutrix sp.]
MMVKGFKAAAVEAGLRYKGRPDLGLIAADGLCAWAGVFTQSVCRAAPVAWSRDKAARGRGRAILVNAGQANAQTGKPGEEHCRLAAAVLADLLPCAPDEIMLASTGIIGQPIKIDALVSALPALTSSLTENGLDDFSKSILTTDTVAKTASGRFDRGGRTVTVWACAKGSGMIAPNMATMLGFILTDAEIAPDLLRELLLEGAEASFNRVTVDGDTSTNDSLIMMASGASGAPEIMGKEKDSREFRETVFGVMSSVARQIARDGEGATHLVTVRVRGAASPDDARKAARTVAESPLVKTAFFGCDANWGRICMALGRCGAEFDPYAVNIDLDETPWIRNGLDNGQEEAATRVMKQREYTLDIDLRAGTCEYEALTCDFSHDYVSINGSYRS